MTTGLTPDAHAALVGIFRRAARRGRELRGESGTADGCEFDDPLPSAASTLALQRDVHAHDMPVSGLAQVRGVADG